MSSLWGLNETYKEKKFTSIICSKFLLQNIKKAVIYIRVSQKFCNILLTWGTIQQLRIIEVYWPKSVMSCIDSRVNCWMNSEEGELFMAHWSIPSCTCGQVQSKAFDRVDHWFLVTVLETTRFQTEFCRWISILYHSPQAVVQVNGKPLEPFMIKWSVWQSCSLSPSSLSPRLGVPALLA